MTKHEFIQEAALRLIGARPSDSMHEIHRLAKSLADLIYPDDEEVSSDPVRPAPTVSDLSEEPIDNLLAEVINAEHERVENKIQRHGCHFQVGGANYARHHLVAWYRSERPKPTKVSSWRDTAIDCRRFILKQ